MPPVSAALPISTRDGLGPPARGLLLCQLGAPSAALVCAVTAIASSYGLGLKWDACRSVVVHGA